MKIQKSLDLVKETEIIAHMQQIYDVRKFSFIAAEKNNEAILLNYSAADMTLEQVFNMIRNQPWWLFELHFTAHRMKIDSFWLSNVESVRNDSDFQIFISLNQKKPSTTKRYIISGSVQLL